MRSPTCSVCSIDWLGTRYGFTNHNCTAYAIATAIVTVSTRSTTGFLRIAASALRGRSGAPGATTWSLIGFRVVDARRNRTRRAVVGLLRAGTRQLSPVAGIADTS